MSFYHTLGPALLPPTAQGCRQPLAVRHQGRPILHPTITVSSSSQQGCSPEAWAGLAQPLLTLILSCPPPSLQGRLLFVPWGCFQTVFPQQTSGGPKSLAQGKGDVWGDAKPPQ